jgi:hypothetical protein
MNVNSQYRAVSDGHGGVRLIPKRGSAVARAVNRLYPDLRFTDHYSLTSYDSRVPRHRSRDDLPPENNLGPGGSRRFIGGRGRDNGADAPVPLDPDLRRLAQGAPANVIQDLYREQQERDRRRGFNSCGDECFEGSHRDQQLPEDEWMGPRFNNGDRRRMRDQDPDAEDEQEEPDGEEVQQILAELEPPPAGFCYNLWPESDGSVTLRLEPDTGDPPNTNDRMFRHTVSDGVDPVLRRMNQIHRGTWVRDAATVTSTLLRHRPLPGERLELRGPSEITGSYDLVLISPAPGEGMFKLPRGAEDDFEWSEEGADDVEMSGAAGKPGERELPRPNLRPVTRDSYGLPESVQLRSMNQSAKAFWSRR